MSNSGAFGEGDSVTPLFVADRGFMLGPVLGSTVLGWLNTGRLSKSALIWRRGLPAWEPISTYFRLRRRPRSRWWPIAAAGAIALLLSIFHESLLASATPPWVAAAWAGTILTTSGLCLLALRAWWQYATLRARVSRAPHLWGVIKVACVLLSLCLVGGEALAGLWATQTYRFAMAVQPFKDYSMDVSPGGDTVFVTGTIGPGFAPRLIHILTDQMGISQIEIRSPGGLLDQAFRVAYAIEDRPEMTVIARRRCESACIIILLAGTEKYADWDMMLGFHAPSAVLPRANGNSDDRDGRALRLEERYLTEHHVAGWILADMERAGPDNMAFISAIDLAEHGMLTGLLDGAGPVTLKHAKWLWVERLVERWASARRPISAIYTVIASRAGFVVDRYANALYELIQQKDIARFNYIASTMMEELTASAEQAAEDRELAAYISAMRHQFDRLVATSDWEACDKLREAKAFVTPGRIPQGLLEEYSAALAALIRSADASNWKTPAPAEGAELAATEILRQARMLVAAGGILVPAENPSRRGRCLIAREAFGLLAAAPIGDARVALSWLGRYDRL